MVAAVVLMLRERASLATGEAIAPQASSLTVQTMRPRMGTAMKPARSPKAQIASPEASHSRPTDSPKGVLPGLLSLTGCSLIGRRLEVPLLQDLLTLFARHERHPLLRQARYLGILERGDRIGGDDVEIRWDSYDLHLVPYVRRVVALVAERGVCVSEDDTVDRRPNISLPGDDVGEDLLLEARSVHFVSLTQDLQGVVGGWNVFCSEHELYVRLREVLKTLYVRGVVLGDHNDLAVLDEDLGLAGDETILQGSIHLLLGRRSENVGRGALLDLG